jgi:DNA-binding NarL/FixJ family response regulator
VTRSLIAAFTTGNASLGGTGPAATSAAGTSAAGIGAIGMGATAAPAGAGPGQAASRSRGNLPRLTVPPPAVASLTEREREVVALVAAGLSNDEIAAELVVSPLTAKTHVSRAMIKLGARDRAQLVVLAFENGLAEPGQR